MTEFARNEPGGHRVQELSGHGKKARVHTSTVTCAVIMDSDIKEVASIPDSELEVRFYSGTGKGGQRRNKVMSCCVVTHIPTGITQKADGRSRIDNEAEAKLLIREEVERQYAAGNASDLRDMVRDQRGVGCRADKIRTYRFQDDSVTDHRTGKTMTAKAFMKGDISKLW